MAVTATPFLVGGRHVAGFHAAAGFAHDVVLEGAVLAVPAFHRAALQDPFHLPGLVHRVFGFVGRGRGAAAGKLAVKRRLDGPQAHRVAA